MEAYYIIAWTFQCVALHKLLRDLVKNSKPSEISQLRNLATGAKWPIHLMSLLLPPTLQHSLHLPYSIQGFIHHSKSLPIPLRHLHLLHRRPNVQSSPAPESCKGPIYQFASNSNIHPKLNCGDCRFTHIERLVAISDGMRTRKSMAT